MMTTPGGESPSAMLQGIRTAIKAADTDMAGAGGIGAANGGLGIVSMTQADPVDAIASQPLERKQNR